MEPSPDDLAGVADLFGGLGREEFQKAFENLAARQGEAFDPDAIDAAIAEAIRSYDLVAVEHEGEEVLAPGPAAFPTLPEHAEDLPHMMEVQRRTIERERLVAATRERLREDAVEAVDGGETDRIERLLDLCYEVEAWGSIDLSETREHLAAAIEE